MLAARRPPPPAQTAHLDWGEVAPFVGVAAIAIAAGALVLFVGELVESPTGGVLAGVAMVIAAGAPTAWRLRRDGADAPAAYAVVTILFFGITSLAWLGIPSAPGPGLGQEDIADALRLVALGLLAFGLGSYVMGPTRRRTILAFPDAIPSRTALSVCFLVSIVSVVIAIALGDFSYLSTPEAAAKVASFRTVISLLMSVGNLVVLATALVYFGRRDRRLLPLLVLFTTVEMVIGFVGGTKGFTLLPLLLVVGAYCLVRRRIPVAPIVVTVLFTLVFVIPTNLTYRQEVRGQAQTPGYAIRQVLSAPLELSPAGVFDNTYNYVTTRFRPIDYVALVQTQTPSPFDYAGGKKYMLLPLILTIPRAMWEDKPSLGDAGEFTHTYNQAPASVRSSTPITQPGDLYRNFGFPGVVVGMFLWGIVLSAATLAHHRWRSPRADMVFLFALPTVVVLVESDLPALIATASKTVPFAMLFAWFILPGRSSPPGYTRLLSGASR